MKKKIRRKVVHREPEQIYFEIYEPRELRRKILSSAIEIVDTLKNYELSKDTRSAKEKQLRHAKSVFSHMKSSFRSLKSSLPPVPKYALPKPEKKHFLFKEVKVEVKKTKEFPPQNMLPQESSAVKRLENELSQIRNKLESI
ncbi:hypothetical protein HY500_02515 [Candidatus Woesearchaeota archaeon]|nr:hypothetical protein [Candidatus Woesearchaeota archaeon]